MTLRWINGIMIVPLCIWECSELLPRDTVACGGFCSAAGGMDGSRSLKGEGLFLILIPNYVDNDCTSELVSKTTRGNLHQQRASFFGPDHKQPLLEDKKHGVGKRSLQFLR